MIRATTPTFTFTIKSDTLDLTEAENIYATFLQGQNREITKTGEDLEVTQPRTVAVWLTQEESLGLVEGMMDVQLNWTYTDSDGNTRRAATIPKSIRVTKQLLKRVIE